MNLQVRMDTGLLLLKLFRKAYLKTGALPNYAMLAYEKRRKSVYKHVVEKNRLSFPIIISSQEILLREWLKSRTKRS